MKYAILDTNFILTCVKQKIDFFEDIKLMGFQIVIPKQVINEIEKVSRSKKKLHVRDDALLSLKLLEKNRESYKNIDISKYGKNTDKRIKGFYNKYPEAVVAKLDRELKKKTKNRKIIIRNKKKLEII